MSSSTLSAQALLHRCHDLLSELKALQTCLDSRRENGAKDIRNFINQVQSEQRSLEKIAAIAEGESVEEDRIQHSLKSSNLPFLEAVWARAKCERGVVALNRRIHDQARIKNRDDGSCNHTAAGLNRKGRLRRNAQSIKSSIDIVSDHGLRWIKVSLVTEKRLLFELAENGWNVGDDSLDDSESSSNDQTADNKSILLSIEKTAELLHAEARKIRVRYKHPEIVLDLPNIERGKVKEVDDVLERIRLSGIIIKTAEDKQPVPDLVDVLDKMLSEETRNFSSTINIDCTILLSLVSDISHSNDTALPSQSLIIRKQIEAEARENLLPSVLYPIFEHRKLVCTQQAAAHMTGLVKTIGTPTEKRRTSLIMGHEKELSPDQLIQEFSEISCHTVPKSLRIPLEVMPDGNTEDTNLPSIAKVVANALKHPINRSVFLYGWANNSTTITTNAVVAKQIERIVEEHRSNSMEVGPDVWLCVVPRSLIGKEARQKFKDRW